MMKYTATEQDYIKHIYHLQDDRSMVTTNELAAGLNTRPASVTDMLKKLKAKELLTYERYRGFRLSPDGNKVALGIIRRHRLWEFFLFEKLRFSWEEVHEVAEELEHVTSEKLIEKLDAYLGYPKFDPHGDPIPDGEGRMEASTQMQLSEWPVGQCAEVSSVSDHRADMLELLSHHHIGIGTKLEICRRFSFDHSLEISCNDTTPVIISALLAEQIRVKNTKP